MANAATLLADLLRSWEIPGDVTFEGVRSDEFDVDWAESRLAVGYLQEITESLARLSTDGRRTEKFQHLLPLCSQVVFGLNPKWESTHPAPRAVLALEHLYLLDALGDLIDAYRLAEPADSEMRASLLEKFVELIPAIREADYLPDSTRAYLHALVMQAVNAVTLDSATDQAVRSMTFEASGALVAIANDAQVPDESRGWWRDKASELVSAFTTSAASHVGTAAAIAAGGAVAAITGS